MTHAERVETVRRALAGHLFPGRTDPPPPESGWAAASAEDAPVSPPEPAPESPAAAPPANSRVTPPEPAPDSPADDGAQDAGGALDVCDGRDSWDAHRARDTELRRREAERPTLADRPSLLPLGVERARVRRGAPPPLRPGRRAPGSSCGLDVSPRPRSARCRHNCRAIQCKSERGAAGKGRENGRPLPGRLVSAVPAAVMEDRRRLSPRNTTYPT